MSFFIAGAHKQRLEDRKSIVMEDIRLFLQAVRDVTIRDTSPPEMRREVTAALAPAAELVRDIPNHFDEYISEGSRVLGTLVRSLAKINQQLRVVQETVISQTSGAGPACDPEGVQKLLHPLMESVTSSLGGFVRLLKEVEQDVREETARNLESVTASASNPDGRARSKSTENAVELAERARPKSSWQAARKGSQAPVPKVGGVGTRVTAAAGMGFMGAARLNPKPASPADPPLAQADSQMDDLIAQLGGARVTKEASASSPAQPQQPQQPQQSDLSAAAAPEPGQVPTGGPRAVSVPQHPTTESAPQISVRPATVATSTGSGGVSPSHSLQVDADGSIISGTVERLVEQLVIPTSVDGKYRVQFFFSFRDFLAPEDLLELLKAWFIDPQQVVAISGQGAADEKTIQIVRVKTLAVLRYWVDTYWPDFHHNDEALLKRLVLFLADHVAPVMDQGANQVTSTIVKKQEEGAERSTDQTAGKGLLLAAGAMPKPNLMKKDGSEIAANSAWKFRDVPAVEVARQLTLMEFALFRRIHPWELSGQAWAKDAKAKEEALTRAQKRMSLRPPQTAMRAKNVTALIDTFNQVSAWVKNEILNERTPKARAEVISHFISVGKKCHLQLQSFNTAMEIVASLNHSSITRLKATWPHVSAKRKAELEMMATLMNGNFAKLREQVAEASFHPPLLPYLGVYLSDLTMIDENADTVEPPPGAPPDMVLVNFYKYRKQAVIFEEISGCQLTPYNLEDVPFLQDYVRKVYTVQDEKELFEMSLRVEPRLAEGEATDVRSVSERARDMGFAARTKSFSALGKFTMRASRDKK
jgi:RasGEF domain/RasGEF N-terminal motif